MVVVLPVVPLRERVVEIEAARGTGLAERYRYGSGFRPGGRLVLTAAHVVAGAAATGITVRGRIRCRIRHGWLTGGR